MCAQNKKLSFFYFLDMLKFKFKAASAKNTVYDLCSVLYISVDILSTNNNTLYR